jgi:hypothetical protein
MTELTKYSGSCHCGKVRYEVLADLSQGVVSCNCSLCGRSGALLAFVDPEQFTLLSGQDAVSDYQFNRKVIHHLFCTNCGVRAHGHGMRPDGKTTVYINARCLEGVDPAQLQIKHFDGKHL